MKFEYTFFEGRFLPIISIRLKGKNEWVESEAFVDTGATYCLFHADVAEILGLSLEEGELNEMVVGDGNILRVYLHKVLVSVAGEEFLANVGFSKGIGIGFNIIGRKDVFDQFIVCFHEKEKFVEFTSIN